MDVLPTASKPIQRIVKYNMRKSLDLDQEGCFLQVGKKEILDECGFNTSAKTIFIIHGWTVCREIFLLKCEYFLGFFPPL